MRHFKNQFAQGDVYAVRIDKLPSGLARVPAENDKIVVAHSESGHHHVMDATDDRVEMYRLPESIYECFLVVKEPTPLEHLRPWDTHEAVMYEPGVYHIHRQRERAYTPEGWRRAQD